MNRAQDYEYKLWDDEYQGTPQSYPFVYGPDGQGEIRAPEVAQPESRVEGPATAGESQSSAIDGSQSAKPGVVSYAIPTPVTTFSQQPIPSATLESPSSSADSSPSSSSSPATLVQTSAPTLVVTHTFTQIQTPSSQVLTTPSSSRSSLQPSSTLLASPISVPPTTSILFATPTPPPPLPSTPAQAFRHTPGFIVLLILCLLVFLGTLFASLSWLFNRKRRKEDENWIGTLVYDEPTTYGGGDSGIAEHKNVGQRGTLELEKGGDNEEHDGRQLGLGNAEDSGRAGVGTGTWSSHNVLPGIGRTYTTTARQFTDTPMSGYGFSGAPNLYTPGSVHGFTPNPDYRRPSILQRGPLPVSDYDNSYGLDGGGLTFRRDPALGGTYLAPVTEHADIITPNPYSRSPTPHTRPPPPAHDSASHYSYALDRAGPFAVTNLMPGDISSSASSASLAPGGRVRSLGLPTGRLDDPNPWKRYEGVENRGGVAGVDPNAAHEAGSETGEGGWVGTIRSGLYTAVGRIVGGSKRSEGLDKEEEHQADKFTSIPEPVRRSTHQSTASRQSRILQRLDSTGTTNTASTVTVYSSDDGQVFSTRATSRRDTMSTWITTRSRSARGGKKEDKDEGGGEGGVSEMKARVASTTSSEWGSGDLVRVLGLQGGPGRKEGIRG
ncbi:hypothetical protein FRC09_007989 [Ceratobasidium sp. 395]|nr:hypothetical protein FRC09_007989 [Ceratobasidium sp. 395]